MCEIILSICIPTHNRALFLDYLLKQALENWNFTFNYEIVISDNASSDATYEVVQKYIDAGLPIEYYRQSFNKGGTPNGLTAFHRARGAYVCYLADDDLIIPLALEEAIQYLILNQQIRALYTPWELYDDRNKESHGNWFNIEENVIFYPGQEINVLEFMHRHHIFPEIVIYRNEAIRNILSDPLFCYWAFSYLAHIMGGGPVAFLKKPYYQSVLSTPVMPYRAQLGVEQVMTDWDSYRGGLEYFIYIVLKRSGITPDLDSRHALRDLIDGFVKTRMSVALRLWLERGDYLRAYDLITRLHFLEPGTLAGFPDIPNIQRQAVGQTLARLVNGMAEVDRLVVVGVDDHVGFGAFLQSVGLDGAIAVTTMPDRPDAAALRGSFVFIAKEEYRLRALQDGYAPGLIISERELNSGLHLL